MCLADRVLLNWAHHERVSLVHVVDQPLNVGTLLRVSCKIIAPMICRFLHLRHSSLLHVSVKGFIHCMWEQSSIRSNLCLEKVRKLFKTNLGVSIGVNSANNSEQLSINQVITKTSQEVLQVAYIDKILIMFVNSAEGCIDGVVVGSLDVFSHRLDSLDEINLVLNDADQCHLHLDWQ